MANINHLRMAKTICNDSRIRVSKSLFGLRTTITYLPTGSTVDAKTYEYTAADGDKLKSVLTLRGDKLAKAAADFHPHATANGNYKAEVCLSQDHVFCAIQLLRYSQLDYEPVTDVLFFADDEAQAISRLLG